MDADPCVQAAFGSAEALTTLLTTESLLFAAFSIGFGLMHPAPGGRRISPAAAYRFALGTALTVAVVAAGGAAAWWQVFPGARPLSALRWFEAIAIAVGIVFQPFAAYFIARSGRPREAA